MLVHDCGRQPGGAQGQEGTWQDLGPLSASAFASAVPSGDPRLGEPWALSLRGALFWASLDAPLWAKTGSRQ